jgi:hypothetical protein
MNTDVSFESTNTRTEIIKWYAITNAPVMEANIGSFGLVRKYSPMAARFTFVDGGCTDLAINAYPIRLDGSLGESVRSVPNINLQDRRNWPEWLHDLYKLASIHVVFGL